MLFWVLLALVVVVVIWAVWADGGFAPVGMAIMSLLVSCSVGFLIVFICAVSIPANSDIAGQETLRLRSLGTSSGVEGRLYFLGGGYVGDKRVLNYITDEDGAIKVRKSDADASTIYEDSKTPTVTVRHFDHTNGWIVPWVIGSHNTYEFHIPEGSVMSDYTVDNK